MTVRELIEKLQYCVDSGWGDRLVRMGDPQTSDYVEVTGLWIPGDEDTVNLESGEWTSLPRGDHDGS